jgi:hypothetical protein
MMRILDEDYIQILHQEMESDSGNWRSGLRYAPKIAIFLHDFGAQNRDWGEGDRCISVRWLQLISKSFSRWRWRQIFHFEKIFKIQQWFSVDDFLLT